MTSCGAIGNGDGLGGSGDLNVFAFDFETTDATPVIQVWAQLPTNGSGVLYEGRVEAVQNTGANGQYAFIGGAAGRNATGSGLNSPIAGGQAWTPPGAPFATLAAPGWTMILADLAANQLRINMAGLGGQTIRWSGWIIRRFIGGATP